MLRHQRDTDADVFLRVPSDHIPTPLLVVRRQCGPVTSRGVPHHPGTLSRVHSQHLDPAAVLVLQDAEGNCQID